MATIILLSMVFLMMGCSGSLDSRSCEHAFSIAPDLEYNHLFERRDGWTGGDEDYSLALTKDTILWLFGDSWIGPIRNGKHVDSTMVNNAIAIQHGLEPGRAELDFYWGHDSAGKPAAFFTPADGRGWFWPNGAVRAGPNLYLFCAQFEKTDSQSVFGFRMIGSWLLKIVNPQDPPPQWRVKQYLVPYQKLSDKGNFYFGSAVLKYRDYIYIYGCKEDWQRGIGGRGMVLARVRADEPEDFGKWRFFTEDGWQDTTTHITELFSGIATEYSVSFQPDIKKFIVVYTEFGMSDKIVLRSSPTPAGPWSGPQVLYHCPEAGWDDTYFCYAAKAHPELASQPGTLIITYVCNSSNFWKMASDSRIYFPRFLRLHLQTGYPSLKIGGDIVLRESYSNN